MLTFSGCKTCQKNDVQTIIKYQIPNVYFPKFPAAADGVIVPLDEDFHTVTDYRTQIKYVVMPEWYFTLLIDWSEGMIAAKNSLYSKVEESSEE